MTQTKQCRSVRASDVWIVVLLLGILGFGPATPPVFASSTVAIAPNTDVVSVVAGSPAGTTFVFSPGTYRNVSIRPKDSMVFIAEPGAILNGSTVIDSFTQMGSVWVATGVTAQGFVHGACEEERSMCSRPEDIYIDSVLSEQIESVGDVGPGTFQLDYESDTLTIGDNPDGRTVEITTTQYAFVGSASDITINGFIIEKYSNPAQSGAIQPLDGNDLGRRWNIINNEIRYNHGVGVKLGEATLLENNRIHSNGQLGVGACCNASDNVIRNNEVYNNTTLGFSQGWEAGGMKLTRQIRLTVEGNYVYDNNGPGIWTDIDNIDVTIDSNVVENNYGPGIFHEISYRAVIKDNMVIGNGFGWQPWFYGAGILIAHSPDVEVTGNIVKDNRRDIIGIQQERDSGQYGARELRNLFVHDNIIVTSEGSTGIAQDVSSMAVFSEWNNRFESNTYYLDDPNSKRFIWRDRSVDFNAWKAYGNDADGTTLDRSTLE